MSTINLHSGIIEQKQFIKDYINFLSNAKTERLCVAEAERILIENGFKKFNLDTDYISGDRVYFKNRDKNIAAFIFGKAPLTDGIQILGAHIDAPRIDIKQQPLYELDDIAYFDTQYYGGIKKYQWTTTPLAIHGVVCTTNGNKIIVDIGDDDIDPIFCITDLLPHLDKTPSDKPLLCENGEKLDIIVATNKKENEEKDAVKKAVLDYVKNRYGIEEEDFCSAELELVPAGKARYCGLDKSLIAGYGQDDRSCAFTSLRALTDIQIIPAHTCGVVLVDKEEIGSTCNTGAKSRWFEDILRCLILPVDEIEFANTLYRSNMLSSDVTAAFDPLYADAYDKKSSAKLGQGIMFSKYNGGRGKCGGADANPEYIAYVRNIMKAAGNKYQFDSMGKVDVGGGGTIASLVSTLNMNIIDAGIPILNMHSPLELAHVDDIYAAYKAYNSFILA